MNPDFKDKTLATAYWELACHYQAELRHSLYNCLRPHIKNRRVTFGDFRGVSVLGIERRSGGEYVITPDCTWISCDTLHRAFNTAPNFLIEAQRILCDYQRTRGGLFALEFSMQF